jgi:hypothetical protein
MCDFEEKVTARRVSFHGGIHKFSNFLKKVSYFLLFAGWKRDG